MVAMVGVYRERVLTKEKENARKTKTFKKKFNAKNVTKSNKSIHFIKFLNYLITPACSLVQHKVIDELH